MSSPVPSWLLRVLSAVPVQRRPGAMAHLLCPADIMVGAGIDVDGSTVTFRRGRVFCTGHIGIDVVALTQLVATQSSEQDRPPTDRLLRWVRSGANLCLAGVPEVLNGPTVMVDVKVARPALLDWVETCALTGSYELLPDLLDGQVTISNTLVWARPGQPSASR